MTASMFQGCLSLSSEHFFKPYLRKTFYKTFLDDVYDNDHCPIRDNTVQIEIICETYWLCANRPAAHRRCKRRITTCEDVSLILGRRTPLVTYAAALEQRAHERRQPRGGKNHRQHHELIDGGIHRPRPRRAPCHAKQNTGSFCQTRSSGSTGKVITC